MNDDIVPYRAIKAQIDAANEERMRDIERLRVEVEDLSDRLGKFEAWRENLSGRLVIFGILGAIFVATTSAVLARIISNALGA